MTRSRRLLLGAAAASLAWPALVLAQQTRSLNDPLRLGVDQALMASGPGRGAAARLRARHRRRGAADAGGLALPLLEALERGEIDAALTNAPEAGAQARQAGAGPRPPAHRRHGDFVLVGPAPKKKVPDPAGIARMTRRGAGPAAAARRRAGRRPAASRFLTAGDGSGSTSAEQALWRAAQAGARGALVPEVDGRWPAGPAGAAPAAPTRWSSAAPGCAQAGAPLAVLVEGDARMADAGARDALVPRQPPGRQALHRLDHRAARAAPWSPRTAATARPPETAGDDTPHHQPQRRAGAARWRSRAARS